MEDELRSYGRLHYRYLIHRNDYNGRAGSGMQFSDRGRVAALNWALNAANDSASRLGSAKTGPLFGRLVDELQLQVTVPFASF